MTTVARIALVMALLSVALVTTLLVFGVPLGEGLRLIGQGSLLTDAGWTRSLVRATPLVFIGLGMAVAWRAGMYNIGGEGQYVLGGLAGATSVKFLGLAATSSPVVPILAGCMGGGALAWLAGVLQVKRGIPVVISTILLNFMVLPLQEWLLQGPLQEAKRQIPQTDRLPDSAMLVRFDPKFDLHAGIFIALAVAIAMAVYLYLTPAGFRLRVVGAGPRAARAHRISSDRVRVGAMVLSGALCGLAGGVDLTGLIGYVGTGFDQGWGFMGIPVALLGGLEPLGVLLAALYFGALVAGCENLARFADVGSPIVYVVQAMAVLVAIGLGQWRMKAPKEAEAELA